MAQIMLSESLLPKIVDALVARDLRPEAVAGRVPGRDVDVREGLKLVLADEWVYSGRWSSLSPRLKDGGLGSLDRTPLLFWSRCESEEKYDEGQLIDGCSKGCVWV